MITISCECGLSSSTGLMNRAETRVVTCGCGDEITIWRANGPVGQLRYRSIRQTIRSAPVPCERAADDGAVRVTGVADALSHVVVEDIAQVREMVLAGRMELGLVSKTTGSRVVYSLSFVKPSAKHLAQLKGRTPRPRFFVRVQDVNRLTTQDRYLGVIYADTGRFYPARKVDPALETHAKAFAWFWAGCGSKAHPGTWTEVHKDLQVWRGCACVRCGNPLRDPLSMHSGWGPECAEIAGVVRMLPISLDGVNPAALSVLKDLMLDLGETNPSKPAVIRAALLHSTEGGERGDVSRMAVAALCGVLGLTEDELRDSIKGRKRARKAPELAPDRGELPAEE